MAKQESRKVQMSRASYDDLETAAHHIGMFHAHDSSIKALRKGPDRWDKLSGRYENFRKAMQDHLETADAHLGLAETPSSSAKVTSSFQANSEHVKQSTRKQLS